MLLFEDLALVPMLFLIELIGGHAETGEFLRTAVLGILVVGGDARCSAASLLPSLFAQAARTKNPELFLAISLLTVILASLATGAVGLSPILGALIAGIADRGNRLHAEVEAITAPLAGLALGIFLITVGMRIDFGCLLSDGRCPRRGGRAGPQGAGHRSPRRTSGVRTAVAIESGVLMASPSETSLIVLGAAAARSASASDASFWTTVTAIGLTVTPLLAALGRASADGSSRQRQGTPTIARQPKPDHHLRLRPRRARWSPTCWSRTTSAYLAIDSDIDGVRAGA